jgi:hypothetical protein
VSCGPGPALVNRAPGRVSALRASIRDSAASAAWIASRWLQCSLRIALIMRRYLTGDPVQLPPRSWEPAIVLDAVKVRPLSAVGVEKRSGGRA